MAGQGDLSMSGQAVLTITPPASTSALSLVPVAFNLGWRIAQLYSTPLNASRSGRWPADKLPSASQLSGEERLGILTAQVEGAVRQLTDLWPAGVNSPDLNPIHQSLAALLATGAGPERNAAWDAARHEILQLHLFLWEQLAVYARLQTGYGLGRMLADTCLIDSADPSEVMNAFNPYRLANAYDWLGQLDESFPPRAARAVAQSLRLWETRLTQSQRQGWRRRPALSPEEALRRLHRQGELWRRLLAAEQDPLRLLVPEDYVAAGGRFLTRVRHIVLQFTVRWAGVILVLLAAVGAAVWAAVTYAPNDTGKLAAIIASLVGALGLSWKGISATLGKAISEAQKPLWDAEVSMALALAVTDLPHTVSTRRA